MSESRAGFHGTIVFNSRNLWSQKIGYFSAELAPLPDNAEKQKYSTLIESLRTSIQRYHSTDAYKYRHILEGMTTLETEIPKLVWKDRLKTLRENLANLPEHLRESYLKRIKSTEDLVKKFNAASMGRSRVDSPLIDLEEALYGRIRMQKERENEVTNIPTIKANKCCWLLTCFGGRNKERKLEEEELDNVTTRLLAP